MKNTNECYDYVMKRCDELSAQRTKRRKTVLKVATPVCAAAVIIGTSANISRVGIVTEESVYSSESNIDNVSQNVSSIANSGIISSSASANNPINTETADKTNNNSDSAETPINSGYSETPGRVVGNDLAILLNPIDKPIEYYGLDVFALDKLYETREEEISWVTQTRGGKIWEDSNMLSYRNGDEYCYVSFRRDVKVQLASNPEPTYLYDEPVYIFHDEEYRAVFEVGDTQIVILTNGDMTALVTAVQTLQTAKLA